jgi:hypothetical protein
MTPAWAVFCRIVVSGSASAGADSEGCSCDLGAFGCLASSVGIRTAPSATDRSSHP